LDNETCPSTDCCVLFGGTKCVAGKKAGPSVQSNYNDTKIKNRDYYYYKGKCYGNCAHSYGIKDTVGYSNGTNFGTTFSPSDTTATPTTPVVRKQWFPAYWDRDSQWNAIDWNSPTTQPTNTTQPMNTTQPTNTTQLTNTTQPTNNPT